MGSFLLGERNAPIPYGAAYPRMIIAGQGPYVQAADGREFMDLWMGFGTLLLGHRDERFLTELEGWIRRTGLMHSYHHPLEDEVAEAVCNHIASAERIRFMMTGREATSYCLRLARARTGRERVLLVDGGYHGVNDSTSYRAPSGIPRASLALVDRVPLNNVAALTQALESSEYAAFMLEPVLGNAGVQPAQISYLQAAREICDRTGTVLVFDEVMTGFRRCMAGAQGDAGVTPDLTALAKALGGGVPIAAVCGREAVMREFYPYGQVAQEGTFYGSPLSLAAARIALSRYEAEGVPEHTERLTNIILAPLRAWSASEGKVVVSSYGGMFGLKFVAEREDESAQVYALFADHLARGGVLVPPMSSEASFVSVAHAPIAEELGERLLKAAKDAVAMSAARISLA